MEEWETAGVCFVLYNFVRCIQLTFHRTVTYVRQTNALNQNTGTRLRLANLPSFRDQELTFRLPYIKLRRRRRPSTPRHHIKKCMMREDLTSRKIKMARNSFHQTRSISLEMSELDRLHFLPSWVVLVMKRRRLRILYFRLLRYVPSFYPTFSYPFLKIPWLE